MAQSIDPIGSFGAAPATMREERRIVTALFADLVGSTGIIEQLDPEDAREILGGAITLVIEQVDALGGTVKDLAGDGVLALFGAPVAHEDDAERAVLCGIRIASAISDYAAEVSDRWRIPILAIRVGIETGPAVMGAMGSGSRVEYGATGDALNTAARLQALADPGTILVGQATRSMVEDSFQWGPARSLELRGKEALVEAAPAIAHIPRTGSPAGRLEAPIIGRDDDLAMVEQAFVNLRAGRGSVVVLEGDPGVGKSRMLAACRERFTDAFGGDWLEGSAASYGASVPYLPYKNMLLAWMRLPLDASTDAVHREIDAARDSWSPAVRAALADLDPMIGGWNSLQPADPQAAQATLFRAMRALLTALAATRPTAVVLEDLHWSDGVSLALTEALAVVTADNPLLLVVTLRLEPTALAAADRIAEACADTVRIRLAPLSRESDRQLLHALVGTSVLPRALEERLLGMTDGNPFFMEEQVRALVHAGALVRTDGQWQVAGTAPVALAPTVERALMARIDRLPDRERSTLMAGSVLGSRFELSVIAEVLGDDPREPLAALEGDQFLLRVEDRGGGEAYRFRHALVQEAAYRSILRRQRRLLHARAAAAIELHQAGRTDEAAAMLGRHLTEAGEPARAVGYLLIAARNAAAAFANREAADLCEQALTLLGPELRDASNLQRAVALELLAIRVTSLRFLARYDEALVGLRSAIELTSSDPPLTRARLHVTAAAILVDAHRYAGALAELDAAETCVGGRLADDDGFDAWLDVQLGRCNVLYWQGDVGRYSAVLREVEPHIAARATLAQRIRFYGAVRSELWRRDRYVISPELLRLDHNLYEAQRQADDPAARAWAPFLHGFTLLWHRDLGQAALLLREALAQAEVLDDTLLRSRALTYLMVAARMRGDVAEAEALIEGVREAAREAGLPEYGATASATAAWIAWRRGDLPAALAAGNDAMGTWERLPARYFLDWMACLPLVASLLAAGDVSSAVPWVAPLLADTQQPLPEDVAGELRAFLAAADSGDDAQMAVRLVAAVKAATELGYL